MREQLIRYLLGEMDAEERRQLRLLLRENPELERELAHLRECFAANQESEDAPLPPRNLASRTADCIANSDEYELEAMASTVGLSRAGDPPSGVLGWSLADLTVAGGVMLAVSMLVFPALRDSREGTRRNVCQNNQQQLYLILSKYAQGHDGQIPNILPGESVGMYVARLIESGCAEPDELKVLLVCPAAPSAKELRSGSSQALRMLRRDEMRELSSAELRQVSARMSPCYAYRLPQKIGDAYIPVRINSPRQLRREPIYGDAATDVADAASPQHGGSVVQILFDDGSVKAISTESLAELRDDLFHNYLGFVAAGIGWEDVVLAPAYATSDLEVMHP